MPYIPTPDTCSRARKRKRKGGINISDFFACYTPEQAWDVLLDRRRRYYNRYAAVYGGDHHALRVTADSESFWKRKGKARVHVPVAADIAAMSADLLFGEEPRYSISGNGRRGKEKQERLTALVSGNALHSKLCEAAESASVLGGVCLKINWNDQLPNPVLSVVQADNAVPEYRLGMLMCMHFFTVIRWDRESGRVWRMYERYESGTICMGIYEGTESELGEDKGDSVLSELGYDRKVVSPVDDMLCAYIPNMRPNRVFRHAEDMGRSDLEGLRDLMDALDEAYSSWMRDVRLSKSRLIVPAEYLRRNPASMFRDGAATYEFDEDVETLVALDIDTSRMSGAGIQPSQFQIRTQEHAQTCEQLMRNIISIAGYSPQSFGMDIHGQAESGTALHIREKKSYATRSKKENYWKAPLEKILTALIQLDAVVYGSCFEEGDRVVALFSDSIANDLTTTAQAVNLVRQARAASTEMCVRMLHPDWETDMVEGEVKRIREEAEEKGG